MSLSNQSTSSTRTATHSARSSSQKWSSEGSTTRKAPSTVGRGRRVLYRELVDLDYAMPKQREGGVTLSIASNGGEGEWLARDILQTNTNDTLRFLNDEYLEIRDR